MSKSKESRLGRDRYRFIRPRNYNLTVRKLPTRTILFLLEVMQRNHFYCKFRGKEYWNLSELKQVMDGRSLARQVRITFQNIACQPERGSLLDLFFDQINQHEHFGGTK